ncbi:MAG: PTS ascorbate transporter subunit IIC [Clostridia bacterium]|nr:PTS ascorbate transporter subunit IIC [Clostridia bacterium]
MADTPKKQIPLRLSKPLYDALSAWAEEDFRSLNGQIEYLLTQCIRQHRQNGPSDIGASDTSSDQ